MSKNVLREVRNRVNAERREALREASASYLVFRVEQYASDAAYPHLQQQQRILSQVVESVEEDFPLSPGEDIVFHSRPNCGCEYVGIRLAGAAPTEEQLSYLRTVRPWAYKVYEDQAVPRIVSYEVLPGALIEERTKNSYYFWSHDCSQEIAL